MEKITYEELLHVLDDPITRLADEIERIARERGIPIPRGFVRKLIEDAIEDLHVDRFVKSKLRKISKWFKKVFS